MIQEGHPDSGIIHKYKSQKGGLRWLGETENSVKISKINQAHEVKIEIGLLVSSELVDI